MALFKIINKVIEVLYRLDLLLKIKIYVRGEGVYIYTSLRGKVCAHAYAYAQPRYNNA